ncbi:uncharacterized protein MKZ38_005725 [Zalerion maritima]|uniref:Uncharacterized protein n=1 Tax=Zalerion maritima TaxID=339359 RepID=A0AAD5RQ73_9PEZI|nr:uncharacterized protein MKZ38_005725 [Zalerion maritima]
MIWLFGPPLKTTMILGTIVEIPEVATLSETERTAVLNKARQLQAANALASRLRSLTPPVDEDEKNEESRRLEAHARKELEDAGCPPCYPPDVDLTTRNVPQKFQAIVDYWLASLRTDDVVLCAQVSAYRKFLADQLQTRRRFRNKCFGKYEDEVRERRRRYCLLGDVHLLPDSRQQSRLQNWVEFQNYHLKILELLETEQDESQQKLDDARKLASDRSAPAPECAGGDAEALEHILERAKRSIGQRKVLLDWIEQWRQTVLSKAGPRISARGGRRRGSKASSPSTVLGQAKVVEAKPKKRKTPIRKPRQPKVEPTIQDLDAIPQAPIRQETTPRLTKEDETLLRPFRLQRVTKATRFANGSGKPLSAGVSIQGISPSPLKPDVGVFVDLGLELACRCQALTTPYPVCDANVNRMVLEVIQNWDP